MKKALVIAGKAVFGVAKVVLAILGALVLAVVASVLLSRRKNLGCKKSPADEEVFGIMCGGA